uniref:BRCA1-associated protein n=1 Tax=Bursaphelenchus xylophilus TaxID=6326 RepID=A0A1I7SSD0_BURXY
MFPRKNNLPRPSATLYENEATPPPITSDSRPTQRQCFGRRTYSEVVVETLKSSDERSSVQPSTSRSSVRSKTPSIMENAPETLSFNSGNPLVEKTTGILHFYKNKSPHEVMRDNCWTLCMMEVPAYVTCSELIRLISPAADNIRETKIIRDGIPNQYYVLIKFKTSQAAFDFFGEFNGTSFNSFETSSCNLLFVERMETATEEGQGSLPIDGMTELPMCAVCLEKMDDGVMTILCNHSFHAGCLQHWEDTTCPVCRFNQTPELLPDQTCSECGKTSDLWMCLICGNIGCGRYASAHAYRHFEQTSHTFTLQLGGNLVWDYAGDNYVHRLIQSSTDGKMVEFQGAEDQKGTEKMDAIQLEYSCLLSSQLEDQRLYFEGKLKEVENRFNGHKAEADEKILRLETEINKSCRDLEETNKKVVSLLIEKGNLEKKMAKSTQIIRKLQAELEDEKQMSKMIRDDKEILILKNQELEKLRATEIKALEEQISDLMMHFEAQTRLAEQLEKANVTSEELADSNVQISQADKPQNSRKIKKKR